MTETNGNQPRTPDAADDPQEELVRVVHDINNATGGLISNLYLCLADIEPDHPLRHRLEAANATSLRIRSLMQQLETIIARR